jgi:hypothetical protein
MTNNLPEQTADWFPLPVPAPIRTAYEDLGLRPDATPGEIRVATARKVRALKRSGATEDELAELNASALTSVDRRAVHDEDHPPCAILRLEPVWSPLFDDSAAAVARVRRDLEAFLPTPDGAEGTAFPGATDLGRADFTEDFRPNPLLDRKDIG